MASETVLHEELRVLIGEHGLDGRPGAKPMPFAFARAVEARVVERLLRKDLMNEPQIRAAFEYGRQQIADPERDAVVEAAMAWQKYHEDRCCADNDEDEAAVIEQVCYDLDRGFVSACAALRAKREAGKETKT